MKALIIDDEKHCSDSLLMMLEKNCPQVEVVDATNDPIKGIGLITAHKPDVVFLDIEMPHMSGFELLSKLEHIDFEIVFTTAYDEFALRAFKVNALDYLLKPIGVSELRNAVEKVKVRMSHSLPNLEVRAMLNNISPPPIENTRVALPTMEGLEFVPVESIIRCESDSNYTDVHLADGKRLTISKTLKEIQQMLEGKGFYRVHNSHLINLQHIQKYQRGAGGLLIMDNGDHVQVSRSKKSDFLGRV
ncbi:MAG TPA: DNA-binding response regulator [Cryomorphaceae bacterium]|nr:DNA-binding response regulator [Owenweeksia sp.]HAD98780.1 DNA-binding response regulator [Cryomorphaceae bacterium]HBF19546.1 DNA-binding response regulator [Cryomorphaceae bacterium]HCQ15628.1 DNA-binding response regulator [Cryomorphaceae bacterium]|tara:strand:+ start:10001 stop:10738 length:738 start_codon:yes stop_codon:yes gene_type:complete